ncbi:MAG TPA: NAD(P)-dependent oxidoreductase [Streptosporangiaceae bacterium]|nr:NAD(P)-dependent oxidoreductase [Streptosporangiaceae bacterium]
MGTVGVIGLGHMGLPMARRLLAAAFPVMVWNRTASRAVPVVAEGARQADSPQELGAESDIVITMLADEAAARAVLGGSSGVLAACGRGTLVIEMSTIGPVAARELAAEAADHGVDFLDAPVSGSVSLAGQGALTVLAGGSASAFDRARPVLEALSRTQLHLGPSGSGAAMKLAVNLMIAATNQAIAEALTLAQLNGIDRAAAYDALAASAVASPFVSYKRDAFLHPGDSPASFTTALMHKDLDLAKSVAGDLELPVTEAARRCLAAACAAGLADADFASVAEVLRARMAANPAGT